MAPIGSRGAEVYRSITDITERCTRLGRRAGQINLKFINVTDI